MKHTASVQVSLTLAVCQALLLLWSFAPGDARAAGALLRIACDGDAQGAEVQIDGKFKGDCPVDVQVSEGTHKLRAFKAMDAETERVYEIELRVADGTIKKVEVVLSTPQMSDAAKQRAAVALEKTRRQEMAQIQRLQKSAQSGGLEAMRALAIRYWNGQGVPRDQEQAVGWFRKAAEAGDPQSMDSLASLYLLGQGVPQSDEQGFAWTRKAAEAGVVNAMGTLGKMYASPNSVFHDDLQAVYWSRKAAEAGDADAMNDLGFMYSNGKGVEQSDENAVLWFRKSAEAGNRTAMNNLAKKYVSGKGVEKNEAEAVRWFRAAAAKGSETAAAQLKQRGLQ